ncbi:hypothetical protein A6M27_18105 [Acidithiobacillus thiooxidans]|uniref:Uncharacterized protein n=1 Tax=Acidithiobacillus thiooxidans TaxID=930 RepID=A0A1C2J452_ACITH|nr:hypothetical protein A6P07_19015 [Acidithiobacillus thiooxidans]OCX78142.1 hypothetical protein A6O24_05090 [Acidithiobacillus thiooxidans]OCX82211.1 hypothetical protein A6O26_10460 [Acidithiobacillus thiooxidans]OCX83013.1 hypothetical protein A6M27_18105 [Acidithiobacillus thiooxidans]OFC50201.1 hypothetical protein BAE47_02455 [Acidithiobacillus thiooxidans]
MILLGSAVGAGLAYDKQSPASRDLPDGDPRLLSPVKKEVPRGLDCFTSRKAFMAEVTRRINQLDLVTRGSGSVE